MNFKKVLEKIGLIENVDFVLTQSGYDMLPKTHTVEVTPAVLDEQGNVISPAVTEEQSYTPSAPFQEQLDIAWKQVQIAESDIILLASLYVEANSAFRDIDRDNMNIVNGEIVDWNFTNITKPTLDDLVALIPSASSVVSNQLKKEMGKKARIACQNCLDLIAGHNLELNLSAEQITTMQSTFANIQTALMTNRPSSAKALITALVPDGVIITEAFKAEVLAELAEF